VTGLPPVVTRTGLPPVVTRTRVDLSLYLVTDTALCAGRGVPATVAAAVAGGVTCVQVRDVDATDAEFVRLARAVRRELAGTGVRLLLNDRVHLVAETGADGAHVGQGDLDVASARRLIGPDAVLGLSVQELGHVAAAQPAGPAVDYLGVGPVWEQATKPDAAPPGGLDRFAAIVAAGPWPCVAIGGVGAGRVAAARAAGAAGVAVVSAICGQPDPLGAARALRAEWDEAAGPGSVSPGSVGHGGGAA